MTQEDYVNAAYKWMARKTTQDLRLILMEGGIKNEWFSEATQMNDNCCTNFSFLKEDLKLKKNPACFDVTE